MVACTRSGATAYACASFLRVQRCHKTLEAVSLTLMQDAVQLAPGAVVWALSRCVLLRCAVAALRCVTLLWYPSSTAVLRLVCAATCGRMTSRMRTAVPLDGSVCCCRARPPALVVRTVVCSCSLCIPVTIVGTVLWQMEATTQRRIAHR